MDKNAFTRQPPGKIKATAERPMGEKAKQVLKLVKKHGPITVTALAELAGSNRNALYYQIKLLHKQGLLTMTARPCKTGNDEGVYSAI